MAGSLTVDEEPAPRNWDRFALEFDGGGRLALRDKRRLGRAVLDPDFSHVGPDAAEVGREEFRARIGRGTAPLKARLLDQTVISGVGNLLADEILWRARLGPRRVAGELETAELDRLRRSTRAAMRDAIRLGGAHTGHLIPHRARGGRCPRCGTASSARRSAGAPRSGALRASYEDPRPTAYAAGNASVTYQRQYARRASASSPAQRPRRERFDGWLVEVEIAVPGLRPEKRR